MKTISNLFLAVIVGIVACSCAAPAANEKPESSLAGAWEYLGGLKGKAILTENQYIFVNIPSSDTLKTAVTPEAMAARYQSIGIRAGSYTVQDSVVTCTTEYAKDPAEVGKTSRWAYRMDGEVLHWMVLDENGKVVNEGDSRRIKS